MNVQATSDEEVAIQVSGVLFLVLGISGSLLYAYQRNFDFVSVASCALAAGGAAFLLGCLTGFLFGIPRAPIDERAVPQTEKITDPATAAGKQVSGYRPNTNLEQISDWLTKILVGVGLTQLAQAPRAASALASALSPILGDAPHSGGFGVAMVIYFFVGGFFLTYLWTRLKLGAAFREADLAGIGNQLRNLEARLSDHLAVQPRHDHRDAGSATAPILAGTTSTPPPR